MHSPSYNKNVYLRSPQFSLQTSDIIGVEHVVPDIGGDDELLSSFPSNDLAPRVHVQTRIVVDMT